MKGEFCDMSKERPRRTPMGASDEKSSNRLLVGLGIGLVTSVTGLCFAGTLTAINAMNRQSDMAIATARNMVMNESGSNSSVENDGTVVNTEPVVDTVQEEDDWTSDQIKWMQENHITYDSEGNPRNDKGELVDDPTTKKDESNVVKETPDVGDNVEIPEKVKEAANDEIYTQAEIVNNSGVNANDLSKLVNDVKGQVSSDNVTDHNKIVNIINNYVQNNNINITNNDIENLADSIQQVQNVQGDVHNYTNKVSGLFNKTGTNGFSIDSIIDWFKSLVEGI